MTYPVVYSYAEQKDKDGTSCKPLCCKYAVTASLRSPCTERERLSFRKANTDHSYISTVTRFGIFSPEMCLNHVFNTVVTKEL